MRHSAAPACFTAARRAGAYAGNASSEGTMNLIDRLSPVLIFAAAMLPTVLLVATVAALSLAQLDPSLVLPVPVQEAVTCEPCAAQPPAE
jgi:hypothetical protein